ncbi:KxDL motif-containing protein 1 [Zostera marina]|uniref:KxDL motif-containing protein 1 n=1 Tax=Zostera marina TaxID=29655 RepID=A0A0K9P6E9_ZOSMR|nr:KxDL motif-containing protein 1 [Zostera marina]
MGRSKVNVEESGMEKGVVESAAVEASAQFKSLIDTDQIRSVHQLQHLILGRLQDSNAVLTHFNDYSERCYSNVSGDFSKNTHILKSMKSDLDYIFLKIRNMKAKLSATYPDAFPDDSTAKIMDQRPDLEKPIGFHNK